MIPYEARTLLILQWYSKKHVRCFIIQWYFKKLVRCLPVLIFVGKILIQNEYTTALCFIKSWNNISDGGKHINLSAELKYRSAVRNRKPQVTEATDWKLSYKRMCIVHRRKAVFMANSYKCTCVKLIKIDSFPHSRRL